MSKVALSRKYPDTRRFPSELYVMAKPPSPRVPPALFAHSQSGAWAKVREEQTNNIPARVKSKNTLNSLAEVFMISFFTHLMYDIFIKIDVFREKKSILQLKIFFQLATERLLRKEPQTRHSVTYKHPYHFSVHLIPQTTHRIPGSLVTVVPDYIAAIVDQAPVPGIDRTVLK